jgi:hypothetical protein
VGNRILSKIKHSTFWTAFSLVLGTTPRIALDADRMGIGINVGFRFAGIRELARSTTNSTDEPIEFDGNRRKERVDFRPHLPFVFQL